MPFPSTLTEHAPLLPCLSSVYLATINISNDWAYNPIGRGYYKERIIPYLEV